MAVSRHTVDGTRYVALLSAHLVGNASFPELQVGEDTRFAAQAFEAGQLVSLDAREQMFATIHDNNTSPRITGELGDKWKTL